jgi:hypothetical protein
VAVGALAAEVARVLGGAGLDVLLGIVPRAAGVLFLVLFLFGLWF